MFTQEWKITKKIPGMTWPSQSSDMNITENALCTIEVKLQSEIDMLQNVCRVYEHSPLVVEVAAYKINIFLVYRQLFQIY